MATSRLVSKIVLYEASYNINYILAYCLFLGYVAENNSFYASLRGNPALQVQDPMSSSSNFINNLGEIADRRFVFVPLIRKSYLK